MLENGCQDRSTTAPRTLTWSQRLRNALESGKFKPPNAAALLIDLDLAHAGDREAQRRIVNYLNLAGVLEALDD